MAEVFLAIYLLVYGTFSPMAVGFGNSEYYTFRDLDDVAVKIHQLTKQDYLYKDLIDEGSYFRLYKITLSAENKFSKNRHCFTTKGYKNLEEIPLPKYEIEGTKYNYLYKKK